MLNLRIREKKPKEGEEEEPKVSPKFVHKDCVSLGIYRKEKIKDLIKGIIMGNQRDCRYVHYKGLTIGLCLRSYNLMAIIYTQCHITPMGSYNLMVIIEH